MIPNCKCTDCIFIIKIKFKIITIFDITDDFVSIQIRIL